MKSARKTKLLFHDMPRDYAGLCQIHLPRPIHDKGEYENTLEIVEALAGFEAGMTSGQQDYFEILSVMLEAWETANVKWPDVTPLGMLKHLLEQHGMSGADLSRLLGGSRQLGPMILRGERSITADHARKLSAHFGIGAGAFIEAP